MNSTLTDTETSVVEIADTIKKKVSIFPTSVIVGVVGGFLWKGFTGAIIGGVVASVGAKAYETYKK